MKVTRQSTCYAPEKVLRRYVKKATGTHDYIWCEVGEDRRYDLRQGTVESHELPEAVRRAADENHTVHYVDWPIS